jgi:hypothetical protein
MSRLTNIGVLVLLLAPGASPAQTLDAVQAALLHKGKDAIVHAVPLTPGYLVTFTVPTTGVMKPLLKAEPHEAGPGAAGTGRPPGIRRPRHPAPELIAGTAVDAERLYVVTATRVFAAPAAEESGRHGSASGPAPAAEAPRPKVIGHQFRLYAFSLADGVAVMGEGYELPLVSEDPNATEAPDTLKVKETLGRGQLELVPGGVKCRGTTVIFEGAAVKSLEVKGKQFTPPPGYFIRDPGERIF